MSELPNFGKSDKPPEAGAPTPPQTASSFTLGVADKNGKELIPESGQRPDPSAAAARQLVFSIRIPQGASPAMADMELYRDLSKIEHALGELYPDTDPRSEAKFRPYFVRLFYVAQLALEGDVTPAAGSTSKTVGGRLSPDVARVELTAIANDLIDDEAPRIKNNHLRELGRWAGGISVPFLVAFVLLMLLRKEPPATSDFMVFMHKLEINPTVAANFMLLWVGTLVGVCLSYAFRTTVFSIGDLTKTDSDYLAPRIRLLFTGALAMLLALFCIAGLGDVVIGKFSLSALASNSMLAFVVGAVLGISEQKLSGTVAKRAGDLFGGAK